MARKKGAFRLITKAETVRMFGISRARVNYLFDLFHLQPLALVQGDRRCKWYRYQQVVRAIQAAPLRRAS